jgi:DNA-binding winged helix-turn-helix (wHTH) protein
MSVVLFGDFVLDLDARELRRSDESVLLSPKAYQLLEVLVRSRPRALSKSALQEHLWPDTFVVEKNLVNLIAEIRQALGDHAAHPRFIRTIQRFGYAFRHGTEESGARGELVRATDVHFRLLWAGGRAGLGDGEHVLGRDPELELFLDAPDVSRRHALIRITGDGATIEDLESKNGTFVGDRRLGSATRLADGDSIRIGSVRLTFTGGAVAARLKPSRRSSDSRALYTQPRWRGEWNRCHTAVCDMSDVSSCRRSRSACRSDASGRFQLPDSAEAFQCAPRKRRCCRKVEVSGDVQVHRTLQDVQLIRHGERVVSKPGHDRRTGELLSCRLKASSRLVGGVAPLDQHAHDSDSLPARRNISTGSHARRMVRFLGALRGSDGRAEGLRGLGTGHQRTGIEFSGRDLCRWLRSG